MTSSIPDGFSMGELELLQEMAAKNDELREEERKAENSKEADDDDSDAVYGGKTRKELIGVAMDALGDALEECNDPMTHKMMMIMIIDNFLEWHSKLGIEMMEEGEAKAAVCWLRDAGKFQAIHNILSTITTGPNDWTVADSE